MDEMVGAEHALGERLQQVRRSKGFTQQQLCQKASLSYSTLAKIERGAIKSPSIFTVQRIAEVLGISLDELVDVKAGLSGTRQLRHTSSGVGFVYFDINGCLLRGYQRAFTAISRQTGVLPDIIESEFWKYNDQINRGSMSMSDFNEVLKRRLGQDVDWGAAYLDAVEPIPDMQQLMISAAEHYKIGLFTNSMPGMVSALRSRQLLPNIHYDAVIDSSEIGAVKPEPKAFHAALERSGCTADELLLVDDTRANVAAAQEAGWHVLQYDGIIAADSLDRVRATLELDQLAS